jgi:hypothetical protein
MSQRRRRHLYWGALLTRFCNWPFNEEHSYKNKGGTAE